MASVPVPFKRRTDLSSVEVDNKDQYSPTSRYRAAKYFQRNIPGVGKFIEPESWTPPAIAESQDDLYTTINAGEEGRLDIISSRVYGFPQLWWVLAYYNKMIDPIEEAIVNKVLRYPTFTRVTSEILT